MFLLTLDYLSICLMVFLEAFYLICFMQGIYYLDLHLLIDFFDKMSVSPFLYNYSIKIEHLFIQIKICISQNIMDL